jgi:YcaO-like protein with predicted kinase domain
VERDALATYGFVRRYCDLDALPGDRIVDPASLPADVADEVSALADRGLRVTVEDLTHDLDVPVFQATIWDPDFPGEEARLRRFAGLGCDLDVAAALRRALAEAAQTHTTVLLGARDAFEGGRPANERGGDRIIRQLLADSQVAPLREAETPPADLWERLLVMLERLARAGFRHCVVVDLTRSDLEVPVVRVLVPGLAGPFGESSRRPGARLLRHLV